MYAYLDDDTVVELVGNDPFQLFEMGYAAKFIECPDNVQLYWIFNGETWNPPLPKEKTRQDIESDIQNALNAFAVEKGFDDIDDACNYASSTIEEWAAEARRAIEVRDMAWKTFEEIGECIVLGW